MNRLRGSLLVLLAGLAWVGAAHAAEIKVLTAGAFKPVVAGEVAGFEQRTGHRVKVENDTAGALLRRIKAGEAFDLVILTDAGARELVQAGLAVADTVTPVAKVGIGVAVRQGAPKPDIQSVDGFRQALMASTSVALIDPAAGGSSGIYLARLFEQWGIAPQVKAKAILLPGGLTALKLASGEADLAVQQMSELVGIAGAVLVGPLPAAIQNYTVYSAVVSAKAADAQATAQLLAVLRGPAVRAGLPARGIEAP